MRRFVVILSVLALAIAVAIVPANNLTKSIAAPQENDRCPLGKTDWQTNFELTSDNCSKYDPNSQTVDALGSGLNATNTASYIQDIQKNQRKAITFKGEYQKISPTLLSFAHYFHTANAEPPVFVSEDQDIAAEFVAATTQIESLVIDYQDLIVEPTTADLKLISDIITTEKLSIKSVIFKAHNLNVSALPIATVNANIAWTAELNSVPSLFGKAPYWFVTKFSTKESSAVQNLKAESANGTKGGHDLKITWEEPIWHGDSALKSYVVQLLDVWGAVIETRTIAVPAAASNALPAALTTSFPNLQTGKYHITVLATNQNGLLSPKEELDYVVKIEQLPTVPNFADLKGLATPRQNAIKWLASTGITVGTSPTTYAPANKVNRGAMADFMYKLVGSPDPKLTAETKTFFSSEAAMKSIKKIDSSAKSRYQNILWLAQTKITVGCVIKSGKPYAYCPASVVNRGAMATFLWKLAGSPVVDGIKDVFTKDKTVQKFKTTDKVRYSAILWLAHVGITTGIYNGKTGQYNADASVNRGAMAEFLMKEYYLLVTGQKIPQTGISSVDLV
jgi:hypothetical protein